MILRFLRDARGHTAIEYSMIAAVGAIGILASLQFMGTSVEQMFTHLLEAWTGGDA